MTRMQLALTAVVVIAATTGCTQGNDSPSVARSSARPTNPATSAAPGNTSPAVLPQGGEPVNLNPADFTTRIDNPYWPMKPGSRWVYHETANDGTDQRIEVTVTDQTRKIIGIDAVQVHDIVTQGPELVEDTLDWYAQDKAGNIWYLGEDTKEYENGKVTSTKGTWLAGIDNAQPGIIVPANPAPGITYRQEYLKGDAEDVARVVSLTEQVTVPAGTYANTLKTEETTPLEPDLKEFKFYAKGIGNVYTDIASPAKGKSELLEYTPG